MAKIACLGWGSSIWNPKALLVETPWREDGAAARAEFLRHSGGDRITLVLDPDVAPVRALWAVMTTDDLDKAIASLRVREQTFNEASAFGRGATAVMY